MWIKVWITIFVLGFAYGKNFDTCPDGPPEYCEQAQYIYLRTVWQYGLWSFQTGGTKLERVLPKNHHTQRKVLNLENWVNGEVSQSAKI